MNKNLLKTGVQEFIKNNWNTDIMSVLLKPPIFNGILQIELAQQLEGKKKCHEKLPTWFSTPKIYYPKKVSLEQTSSEQSAAYKSELVNGKTLIDITGGLGVDSFFFAKRMEKVVHCEIDAELSEITRHNFEILGAGTVKVCNIDGLHYLDSLNQKVDWLYVDPSRRDGTGRRVFRLEDTVPNILEHLEAFFEKTDNILLKTAPLLDISLGLSALDHVQEIHVVAIKNEVKELLWVLTKGAAKEPKIIAVNLQGSSQDSFEFYLSKEKNTISTFASPKKYLYEPNAAILKAGAFKSLGNVYGLQKLHEHSHLYTSKSLIDFPGRCFEVSSTHAYQKREIKKLDIKKANITTRNFPETVANIRKKFSIKDGGDLYLFFTKDLEGSLIVIQCRKTSP